MNSRKLLMIVPYRARDLEGHALVGYHLEKRYGHEVVYSNGYGIERKVMEHAPDALVLDHLSWNFKVQQAILAKQFGMRVIVLPTEGLFQDKEGAVRRAGKLHNATGLVDCYLTWGDYPRNALLEQNLMTESQVHTIGCPRFDFYSEPYLSLTSSKADFLRPLRIDNPGAPLVLWATNTSYAARGQEKMIDRQVSRAKKPEGEVRAHIEDHITQHREHSRVVLELAQRHPDWNFLIKVHPAEWINPYLALEKEAANLYVAFDAPIRDFLWHCDILLQRNCTTATEAWMLGKPVLNLEIGHYRRPVREEYRSGNHAVSDVDEADAAIRDYLAGMEIPPEQQRARESFIAEFFYRIDGKSSERCAELINRVLTPPGYTDDDQARTTVKASEAYAQWKRADEVRIVNRFKDLLGIDRTASLRFWKGFFRGEAKGNLGLFTAEAEISRDMVSDLYRRFESVIGQPV